MKYLTTEDSADCIVNMPTLHFVLLSPCSAHSARHPRQVCLVPQPASNQMQGSAFVRERNGRGRYQTYVHLPEETQHKLLRALEGRTLWYGQFKNDAVFLPKQRFLGSHLTASVRRAWLLLGGDLLRCCCCCCKKSMHVWQIHRKRDRYINGYEYGVQGSEWLQNGKTPGASSNNLKHSPSSLVHRCSLLHVTVRSMQ